MRTNKKQARLKEMTYYLGEAGEFEFSNTCSVFTFPLFGVPVQISGPGLLAILRFLKFERRATRHARKLTTALTQAVEAAREASIYFYANELPRHFGKNQSAKEQTDSPD